MCELQTCAECSSIRSPDEVRLQFRAAPPAAPSAWKKTQVQGSGKALAHPGEVSVLAG